MATVSTRKRGGKNQSWYYSFDAGLTSEGKRKRVEKGGFHTEKEAREEGIKALASYLSGNIALTSKKVSIKDFLTEWLDRKSTEVRAKTLESYRCIAARINSHIGDKSVQSIRPKDIDSMIQLLAKNGLSYGTLSVTLNLLKEALGYAVYPAEILQTNPALFIKVPRNAPRNIVDRSILSNEKMQELMEAFPFGHPIYLPIVIAYHTGMRLGEVLGLAWDCIDMEKGVISVKRQVFYTKNTGYSFGPPKTRTSIRDIIIGQELLSILKKWKAAQSANEMKFGRAYFYTYEAKDGARWQLQKQIVPDAGFVRRSMVCTRENGACVIGEAVRHALHLHGTNSHSLRHTHATICAENGAPPKGIAGRLGHSSTKITENLYTHETEKMQEWTLEAFEKKEKIFS